MLKKIALEMLLALPMGVFAQNLKFGHINAGDYHCNAGIYEGTK